MCNSSAKIEGVSRRQEFCSYRNSSATAGTGEKKKEFKCGLKLAVL